MTLKSQFEQQLYDYVVQEMRGDPAHDSEHILRVVKTAKALCEKEQGDMGIVLPSAYLHDCFVVAKNSELRSKASVLSVDKAVAFLNSIGYDNDKLDAIHHAIVSHSFSANIPCQSLEAEIVQDADRLDALGAIGISRLMQTSAVFKSQIYHVQDPFCQNREPDDKKYAVDHFYAKLFKLSDMLNTNAAKAEAQKRYNFMQAFLTQLDNEI